MDKTVGEEIDSTKLMSDGLVIQETENGSGDESEDEDYVCDEDSDTASLDHASDDEVLVCRQFKTDFQKKTINADKVFVDTLLNRNGNMIGNMAVSETEPRTSRRTLAPQSETFSSPSGGTCDDYLDSVRACEPSVDLRGYDSEYLNSDEYHTGESSLGEDSDPENPRIRRNMFFRYLVFNPKIHWKLMEPVKGLRCSSSHELKHCITCYAIAKGYNIKFPVSEKWKLIATCAPGCPWRISGSKMKGKETMQIKSYRNEHTCVLNFQCKLVTATWLATEYGAYIREHPRCKLGDFIADVLKDVGVQVTRGQCRRAKQKALEEVEHALKRHYAMLYDYSCEIEKSNPGSVVSLRKNSDITIPTFQRYFICLEGLKQGWLNGCRLVIGLDGCFLKTYCKGELLNAIGRDGNNHMFPIVWALVEVENTDSWTWFIHLLLSNNGYMGGGLVGITYHQKGLNHAIEDLLPYAEHRMCARHVYAKFRKIYGGNQLRNYFWDAAKKGSKEEYATQMGKIRK